MIPAGASAPRHPTRTAGREVIGPGAGRHVRVEVHVWTIWMACLDTTPPESSDPTIGLWTQPGRDPIETHDSPEWTIPDTGTPPMYTDSPLGGTWRGGCPVEYGGTAPDFLDLDVEITLREAGGVVLGDGLLRFGMWVVYGGTAGTGTTSAIVPVEVETDVDGTFDGTALVTLTFSLDGKPLGLSVTDALLSGDTLAGLLEWSPYGTWVQTYRCEWTR